MPKYIDAEKLKQDLSDPYLCNITPRIFQIIDNQPTANVQEFTPDEMETIQCSLESAFLDSQNQIAVLRFSEGNYKQAQLEHHRERSEKCRSLLKKIIDIRLAEGRSK